MQACIVKQEDDSSVTLRLGMIRCPDSVAPEQRVLHGGSFSIGRGSDNDWIVADPERFLSKRHCCIEYHAGAWELTDLSVNGTYVNGAGRPLGQGATCSLRSGDRIRLGPYELEVTIEEVDSTPWREPAARSSINTAAELPEPWSSRVASAPEPPRDPSPAMLLPADFNPLDPEPDDVLGPTQPDHVPQFENAFRPPAVGRLPDNWDLEPEAEEPPVPAPVATALQPVRAAPPAAPAASPAINEHLLVAALLRGLGMPEARFADPERAFEQLGQAIRAAVSGIRKTLMARSAVKDEFRIERTMVRPTGNNPLKFSPDDDTAILALLGLGPRSNAAAASAAFEEALRDIRLHELATTTATQAAIRALLKEFAPSAIEREAATSSLDILPAQRKARAWEAYVSLHAKVTAALSDDFDSVFGKAFARAYEDAVTDLAHRESLP